MKIEISEEQALLLTKPVEFYLEESKNAMVDALTTNDPIKVKASYDAVDGWLTLLNALKGVGASEKRPLIPTLVTPKEAKPSGGMNFKRFEYGGTPVPTRDGGVAMFGSYKVRMKATRNAKGSIIVTVELGNGNSRGFRYDEDDRFKVCEQAGCYIVRSGKSGRNSSADIRNYEAISTHLSRDVLELVGQCQKSWRDAR